MFWQVLELIKIANYLTTREDIDPSRIGITGISLGGWLRDVEMIIFNMIFITCIILLCRNSCMVCCSCWCSLFCGCSSYGRSGDTEW